MSEENKHNIKTEWNAEEAVIAHALTGEEGAVTEDCVEMAELLDWIDHGAASEFHEKMTAHVFGCAHCRRQYAELRKTLKLASELRSRPENVLPSSTTAPLRSVGQNTKFRTIARSFSLAASILIIGLIGLVAFHKLSAPSTLQNGSDTTMPQPGGNAQVASNQDNNVSSEAKEMLATKYASDGTPRIIGDDSTTEPPSPGPAGTEPSSNQTRSIDSHVDNIQILEPLPNEAFAGPSLSVKWTPVASTSSYKVEIDSIDASELSLTSVVSQPQYKALKLHPGDYTVQVSSGTGKYSESIQFKMLQPVEVASLRRDEMRFAYSDQLLGIVYERSHLYNKALLAYQRFYAKNPGSNVAKQTYDQYRTHVQQLSN